MQPAWSEGSAKSELLVRWGGLSVTLASSEHVLTQRPSEYAIRVSERKVIGSRAAKEKQRLQVASV
jgi:hypothetical protein